MASNMTIFQNTTFGLALLGAVLSVINTWKALDHDKVKLKVTPKHAIPVGGLEGSGIAFCIEVINRSAFPVTVTEIGFLLRGTKERAAIYQPVMMDNRTLPLLLESRGSFTGYMMNDAFEDSNKVPRRAYARTSCGVQRTGTSPALAQKAKEILEPARKANT